MQWLQALDIQLFRFINTDLANPLFDRLMPWLAGNSFFFPALVLLAVLLVWKGRLRGLIFLVMLMVAVSVSDGFLVRTLKELVARPRPFLDLADVRCLLGKGTSGSFPSAHAANWFAAAGVAFIYFRRSWLFMLPAAFTVAFSRVYNGVHYPSDVLGGAILGAGCAAFVVWSIDRLWRFIGNNWFPLWWRYLPSLLNPPARIAMDEEEAPVPPRASRTQVEVPQTSIDQHWLRLGYLVLALLLVARWIYLASGVIQLSEDEAYQWVWSKYLDWSYYSKPPLIAVAQFVGTTLFGDSAFGVRFLSPLISAAIGLLTLRFFAREVNGRAGFLLLLVVTSAPLASAGSILMTVDPLSVLFWVAAMFSGWSAIQPAGTTRDWIFTGLWMGLGFLSKYTALFQLLCWVVLFALWAPARKHLWKPGPWLALVVNSICAVPVLWWNAQHGWITVTHVAQGAGAGKPWTPTLKFFGEFLISEAFLFNPVFFAATLWACVAMWKRHRNNPRLVYFFSMGAPLFLAYTLQSFRGRVLPNWIAPALVPLFCVMAIYWDTRWRLGQTAVRKWLAAGLALGFALVVVAHDTNLIPKLTGYRLPVNADILHRVREWDQTARVIGDARRDLLKEGAPAFIIGSHYGIVGQTSFYLPEAREKTGINPLVYYETTLEPQNQFYFLPGYTHRKGENAVYVTELDRDNPEPQMPPVNLLRQFDSVSESGVHYVLYHGRVLRVLQFFACRGLR